ncbi:uncharacterized protein LOC116293880, partial [Actinia tenebrosa]|uniref:Uncharacterized protein LOC116293880 n=1 Tax=Actinia tenebrosa TaxID=6105 RepID=A0A6P8HXC2_ACTTE
MFVAVFCWFRKKSGQKQIQIKSSRNPSKRIAAFNTRSCGQEQRNISNANSEGVQIVGLDAVQYAAPVDDIDYPKPSTHNMTHDILYDTDLSTYSEVHDAIPPSAKLTSIYYDDENLYLNP